MWSSRWSVVAVAGVCAVLLASTTRNGSKVWLPELSTSGGQLDLEITNDYGDLRSLISELLPWDYIVEPFRDTTLSVVPSNGQPAALVCSWSITYAVNGTRVVLLDTVTSEPVVLRFPVAPKAFEVRVIASQPAVLSTAMASTSTSLGSFSGMLMSKYVRREIRDLSEEDREAFFSALEVVAHTPLEEGQARYGTKFVNLEYFARKHLDKLGCTPFHDGMSFFTAHAAFSLEMEQALQSVNPAVSLPYWDYTIDSTNLGTDWDKSEVFGDDWFGSATPEGATKVIRSGRFAYTPIPSDFSAPVHNSFGRLTSTVNNDPTEFVARAHELCGVPTSLPLPGCTELLGCFESTTLRDFHDCMEGEVHASIHGLLGGVWDCAQSIRPIAQHEEKLTRILVYAASQAVDLWEDWWASGNLAFPVSCDTNVSSFAECSGRCADLDSLSDEDLASKAYDLLVDASIFDRFVLKPGGTQDAFVERRVGQAPDGTQQVAWEFSGLNAKENQDLMVWLVRWLCHPGKIGAMATGAAANDPIFWPIHPTIDRAWAFIRLSPDFSDFDHTWVDDDCPGHSLHDLLPFSGLFGEVDSEAVSHMYSNQELYQLFDPKNPNLSYVYQNFDSPHCASTASTTSTKSNATIHTSASTPTTDVSSDTAAFAASSLPVVSLFRHQQGSGPYGSTTKGTAMTFDVRDSSGSTSSASSSALSDDEVTIVDVKEGTGTAVAAGDTVSMGYTGWLDEAHSDVFGHGTIEFEVGVGKVITGMDEGVIGMRVGGVRDLTIPPSLGYGASGAYPVIPGNAVLYFKCTLTSVISGSRRHLLEW